MANLPQQLQGDPKRQAVASTGGTVYQAWRSIDAWLGLKSTEQVIYLEGAEDFDVVGGPAGDLTVQVKRTEDSISLGAARARTALENFWQLSSKQPDRIVSMHFLTTSGAAKEQGVDFDGLPGVEAWRVARTKTALRRQIADFLASKLQLESELGTFLRQATDEELRERLFDRFHWFPDQPDIDGVRQSVDRRIGNILAGQNRPQKLVAQVRPHLESWYWQIVVLKNPAQRLLDIAALHRIIEEATNAYLPIPLERIPDLVAGTLQSNALLRLLSTKVPQIPSPLLPRTELTKKVSTVAGARRAILLTGSVFKGKTTVALQVAHSLGPDVWWVNLSGRSLDVVDNILLALAQGLETERPPALVVVDDLDISAQGQRVYTTSLSIVLHRCREAGVGVVLTAQGESQGYDQLSAPGEVELMDVPELSAQEVAEHCMQEGCPQADASFWAAVIHTGTRGHPKLVQVRIIELKAGNWPTPTAQDFVGSSPAAQNIRQLARQLLGGSTEPKVVEFLYYASEISILMHRTVALNLAEQIGLPNAGDVIDSLAGKWLERIDTQWFRTTPLLQTAAAAVWTAEKRKQVHLVLHAAIVSKGNLAPFEAAALMYHAFFAESWRMLALDAANLQTKGDEDTRREVEQSLLWLPYVATEAGQLIGDSARNSVSVRSLQLQVALTLGAETVPKICERWEEEVAQLEESRPKNVMQAVMWMSIASADSEKVHFKHRLRSVMGLSAAEDDVGGLSMKGLQQNFLAANAGEGGLPDSASHVQVMLVFASKWVRNLQSLTDLAAWLHLEANDELRQEFDALLEWPVVQMSGAFVHRAWSADHENVTDWGPWLQCFEAIVAMSKLHGMPHLGVEAARAVSIVYCEYLKDNQRALEAVDEAEVSFGASPRLTTQRAVVLSQIGDHEGVLKVWESLSGGAGAAKLLDPYAYRIPALSAAKLGEFQLAAHYFRQGAEVCDGEGFGSTQFGFLVDAAVVEFADGHPGDAALALATAVHELPAAASEDGGSRWEAVQRVASDANKRIQESLLIDTAKTPIEVGLGSSPNTEMRVLNDGQAGRVILLRAQTTLLIATLGLNPSWLQEELIRLRGTPYRAARWLAAEALLSRAFRASAGFAETLTWFDEMIVDVAAHAKDGSVAHPDQKVSVARPSGSSWFGLFIVAAWMSDGDLAANFRAWSTWFTQRGGPQEMLQMAEELAMALEVPHYLLEQVALNPKCSPAERAVSALRLLQGRLSLRTRVRLHWLLASAVASDGSAKVQEVYNLALAFKLAQTWSAFCHDASGAPIAQPGVVELLRVVEQVKVGKGSLGLLLNALSHVAGEPAPVHTQHFK